MDKVFENFFSIQKFMNHLWLWLYIINEVGIKSLISSNSNILCGKLDFCSLKKLELRSVREKTSEQTNVNDWRNNTQYNQKIF